MEKKILKFHQCIFMISKWFPLGNGRESSFEQTWILFTQGMFCAKFGWNRPSCSGEEDFYISSMYLGYFTIISSQKRAGPFIWTNLTPLNPRMLCSKFGWKWPSDSGDEYFLNFVNVFSLFPNYLPLEKVGAIHLNKLESPFHQDLFCHVWFKLAQWFWRRRVLNYNNIY